MNTAEHVLLIILSGALALLIVLSIVAIVFVIKLIQSVRRIANKAEGVVASAESIASTMKHTATPIGIFNVVKSVVRMAQKAKSKK
jgi:hypothetical protein